MPLSAACGGLPFSGLTPSLLGLLFQQTRKIFADWPASLAESWKKFSSV
jgi:hypothetical protein